MATEIGYAYVTIMPSMRDFNAALTKEIRKSFADISKAFNSDSKDSMKKVGEDLGKAAGESFKRGVTKSVKNISNDDVGTAVGTKIGNDAVKGLQKATSRFSDVIRDSLNKPIEVGSTSIVLANQSEVLQKAQEIGNATNEAKNELENFVYQAYESGKKAGEKFTGAFWDELRDFAARGANIDFDFWEDLWEWASKKNWSTEPIEVECVVEPVYDTAASTEIIDESHRLAERAGESFSSTFDDTVSKVRLSDSLKTSIKDDKISSALYNHGKDMGKQVTKGLLEGTKETTGGDNVTSVLKKRIEKIKDALSGLKNIGEKIKSIDFSKINLSSLTNSVSSIAKRVSSSVATIATNIKDTIVTKVSAAFEAIKNSAVVNKATSAVKYVADKVKNVLQNEKFQNVASTILQGLRTGLSKLVSFATSIASRVLSAFANLGREIASKIVTGIKSAVGNSVTTLNNIGKSIASHILNGVKSVYSTIGTTLGTNIMNGVKKAYSSVGNMMTEVGKTQLTKAANSLGINIGESVAQGFSTAKVAIGSIVSNIVTSTISSISGNISGAIERLDTIQNFPRIMSNMGVPVESAQESINELADSIEGLPTALDDIVAFTQKIFPTFSGDIDKATKSAIAFNNAVVSSGTSTERQASAMEQWSQMMANNKVDMLSWRTVVEAMPAQMQMLAEAFGAASPTELYNMMNGSQAAKDSGGGMTMQELNDMLLKLNSEGTAAFASFEEQAKTATYGIGTALTNVTNRIQKAFESIMNWVGQKNISGFINNISSKFVPLAKQLTEFLDSINAKARFSQLGDTIVQGLSKIGDALEPVMSRLKPIITGTFNFAISVLSKTIDHLAYKLEPLMESVGDTLDRLLNNLPNVVKWVQPIIDAFIDFKIDTLSAGLTMWESIAKNVLPIVPQLLGNLRTIAVTLSGVIGAVSASVANLVGNVSNNVTGLIENLAPTVISLVNTLAPLVNTMVVQISEFVSGAFGALNNLPAMVEAVTLVFDGISDTAVDAVNNLSATIADLLTSIGPYIVPILNNIVPIVTQIVNQISDFVKKIVPVISQLIDEIAPSVTKLIDKVGDNLSRVLEAVQPYAKDVLETIINIASKISDIITVVIEKAAPAIGNLSDFFDNIFDKALEVAPDIGRLLNSIIPIMTSIGEVWVNTIASLMDPLADALETAAPALQNAITVVGESITKIINVLAPHLPTIIETIAKVVEALAPAVVDIIKTLEPYIDPILDLIVYAAEQLSTALVDAINNLKPYIPDLLGFIRNLIDYTRDNLPGLVTDVANTCEWVGPVIDDIMELAAIWVPHILNVVDLAAEILKPILDGLIEASKFLDGLPSLQVGEAKGEGIQPIYDPTVKVTEEVAAKRAEVTANIQSLRDSYLTRQQAPEVNVGIDTFVNNDTSTDVDELCDQIGRTALRKLRQQGVTS